MGKTALKTIWPGAVIACLVAALGGLWAFQMRYVYAYHNGIR
jgi:hypothetical protein